MGCRKYTLQNTGTTIVSFNYLRCEDAIWQYNLELFPGQVRNIWLYDYTFSITNFDAPQITFLENTIFPPP